MDSFYKKVIRTFNEHQVQYLIVGGFAVNFHGYNRTTSDLDLWIDTQEANLDSLNQALDKLGFELGEEGADRLRRNEIITFSESTSVVELMPRMNISTKVSFEEATKRSDQRTIEGVTYNIISLDDLIDEKSKSKRYKDLDDLSRLEEARAHYGKQSKEE